jgi:phosphoglycerol transferase MdoB-like AlkP superfamily enzyme
MSAYRFVFFSYYGKNSGLTWSKNLLEILNAFFMGLRFDLSVIGIVNVLPAVIFIIVFLTGISFALKYFILFLRHYYLLCIGTIVVLFFIDFNFYAYFKDHLNILIYGVLEDDTSALMKTFGSDYNLFLIFFSLFLTFVSIFIFLKKTLKFKTYDFKFPKFLNKFLISLTISTIIFASARGTFGKLPLGDCATISSNAFLNQTAINCVYTLQMAIDHRNEEKKEINYVHVSGYKNNIRLAFADFLNESLKSIPESVFENSLIRTTPFKQRLEEKRPSVIFILAESLGGDIIKYNSDSFNVLGELKKHFDKDIVFNNFISEEKVTPSALEALFLNIQLRPSAFYVAQSRYVYKKYPFASMLAYKEKGYETVFIYGGNAAWRNSGTFAISCGFDKVISADLAKKNYPKGAWGVYDEYLFNIAFEVLNQNDKPKFIFILTTTNHPPYNIPSDYKKHSLEIPNQLKERILNLEKAKKRFVVYQYCAEMVGRFISKVKNSKFGQNVIIGLSGDHSFNDAYSVRGWFNSHKVPFYLYVPDDFKPQNPNLDILGSHLDVMPTLYNLSLSNAKFISEGINLFSKEASSNSVMYLNYIMDKNLAVCYDIFRRSCAYYAFDENTDLVEVKEERGHKKLIKKFLSMCAISDYLLKNTGENI